MKYLIVIIIISMIITFCIISYIYSEKNKFDILENKSIDKFEKAKLLKTALLEYSEKDKYHKELIYNTIGDILPSGKEDIAIGRWTLYPDKKYLELIIDTEYADYYWEAYFDYINGKYVITKLEKALEAHK